MHQDNNKRDFKATPSSNRTEQSRGDIRRPNETSGRNQPKSNNTPKNGTLSINCNIPVLPVIIVMILLIVTEKILTIGTLSNQNPYISLVLVQFLVYLLPCAFFSAIVNSKSTGGLSRYNFRMFSPKHFGFIIFSLAVLIFGNMSMKYLGYILFGSVNTATVIGADENIIALIASTVIVPALAEEILFRGIVFTEYENNGVGAYGAILGSSLLFTFMHFDGANFIIYIFSGIILGVTLHMTRSLATTILIHLLNNGICLFTDTFLKRVSKESISSFFVIFILLAFFLLSVFFWLECAEYICNSKAERISKYGKETEKYNYSRLVPGGVSRRTIISSIVTSPIFIITFVLYLIKIFIIK